MQRYLATAAHARSTRLCAGRVYALGAAVPAPRASGNTGDADAAGRNKPEKNELQRKRQARGGLSAGTHPTPRPHRSAPQSYRSQVLNTAIFNLWLSTITQFSRSASPAPEVRARAGSGALLALLSPCFRRRTLSAGAGGGNPAPLQKQIPRPGLRRRWQLLAWGSSPADSPSTTPAQSSFSIKIKPALINKCIPMVKPRSVAGQSEPSPRSNPSPSRLGKGDRAGGKASPRRTAFPPGRGPRERLPSTQTLAPARSLLPCSSCPEARQEATRSHGAFRTRLGSPWSRPWGHTSIQKGAERLL